MSNPPVNKETLQRFTTWHLLKTTLLEWNADNAAHLSAALAYYTFFSLAPVIIIATAIAGAIYGQDAARGELINQIAYYIDAESAALIQTILRNTNAAKPSLITTIAGILFLFYGATGVFSELKSSLNLIWNAPPSQGSPWRAVVLNRLFALFMVLGCGFLLVLSLVISTTLTITTDWLNLWWPGMGMLTQVANFIISFLLTILVFGLIYQFLPDVTIAWRDVWSGAVATALLFSIGRYLISLYLSYSTIGSTYGAAGSLAVLLLWIYYSAQIFFLGAEFTQVYARTKGTRWREHELLAEEPPVEDATSAPEARPGSRQRLAKSARELTTAVGILTLVSIVNLVRGPLRK
ncbi:MAG: YihY/virulence factor BrkB family protein [Caldilineaceae bacterium]|nr:YihY/virulence factor BrkB family protein [Caldilineaceae bacterium]